MKKIKGKKKDVKDSCRNIFGNGLLISFFPIYNGGVSNYLEEADSEL